MLAEGLTWERIDPPESKRRVERERRSRSPTPRRAGEALIPFARLDLAYQNVEGDVESWDTRIEGGYGPLAGQLRWTRFFEVQPADDLTLLQAHALYRSEGLAPESHALYPGSREVLWSRRLGAG